MRVFRAWGVLEFSIRHTRIRFPKRNASRRGLAPRGMRFFRCFNHIAQINPHQPDFQRREMISGRSGLICATWLKQRKKRIPRRCISRQDAFRFGKRLRLWRMENSEMARAWKIRISCLRKPPDTTPVEKKRARRLKLTLGDRKKPLVAEIHRK